MAGEQRNGGNPYIRPRIVIAGALTVLLAFLLWKDATDPGYAMSELTLTVILGSIITLLGIEVNDMLRGGRP